VGYDPNPRRVKDAPKTIPFLVGIFALAIAAESIVLLITVLPAISPNEVLSRFLSQTRSRGLGPAGADHRRDPGTLALPLPQKPHVRLAPFIYPERRLSEIRFSYR
jgi:hypothetical protein